MPEHLHMLIGLPVKGDPSIVLKVIKQRSARQFLPKRLPGSGLSAGAELRHFWQKRFYDFNVYSVRKLVEKLKYMHRNPVKRGLVQSPEQWDWSSFRHYMQDEEGMVKITKFEDIPDAPIPLIVRRDDVRKAQAPEARGSHSSLRDEWGTLS